MIIIDNNYDIDGLVYRRTVSDSNLMIRKVGTDEVYSEAVDLLSASWAYEETDEPVSDEPVGNISELDTIADTMNNEM